jgi:hypothetical protein
MEIMKKSKIFLLVLLFAMASFLSSCMFPGPGKVNHGGGKAPHFQKVHPGNNGHPNKHDN